MELEKDYIETLESIKEKIRRAQYKANIVANAQLLFLYWEIGQVISLKEQANRWGTKVVEKLSADLRSAFPNTRGFSLRNLRYMRDFALAYPELPILQPVVAKLPWAHNLILLQRCKDEQTRNFYAEKTLENGWSKSILEMQIETQLHKRIGQATTNFDVSIPDLQSDLVKEVFKDPCIFNFLVMDEKMKERELEDSLLKNITKFLLELGAGFAFVAQQKIIDVAEEEFVPDLIFYHIKLRRYVVIDLKMTDFKPEYTGKMNFYLSVFDDQWKTETDNPSIGLLLCKGAKKVIAEYALRGISQPIGVSSFLLKGEPMPEELKGALPSIEKIEEIIQQGK